MGEPADGTPAAAGAPQRRPPCACVCVSQLTLATAAACCAALGGGWVIGVWGGITAMPHFREQGFFPAAAPGVASGDLYCLFSDQVLALSGSLIYLTALPAVAAAAPATRKLGRRPTMWAAAALAAAGAAAGAAARGAPALLACRALQGAAMGCSFQAPVILLSEVLPPAKRGVGLVLYNVCLTVGYVLPTIVNRLLVSPPWGWRLSLALSAAPAAASACLLPFVRESPQALLQLGRGGEAEQALRAIRAGGADAEIAAELDSMRAAQARGAAAGGGGGKRARALSRRYLPELTASILYPLVLMLSGMNVLGMWTPNLLLSVGASAEFALASTIIQGVVGIVANAPALFVIDRYGRRLLLAAGGVSVTAAMGALAALLAVFMPPGTQSAGGAGGAPPPASLAPAVTALLCVIRFGLSCTLHPLAIAVPAEVQPVEIRASASSLTTMVRNGSSFLVTQFALPLLCGAKYGLFIIFAAATGLGCLALLLLVPETRGTPLEDVYLLWGRHWFWGRQAAVRARGQQAPGLADADVEASVEPGGPGKDAAGRPPAPDRAVSLTAARELSLRSAASGSWQV